MTRIDISAAIFDAVERGEPITILGRKYVPAPAEPAKTLRELINESQRARTSGAWGCKCGMFAFTASSNCVYVNGMVHRRDLPCYDESHP